ncbi:MAG: tRNA pseudouridine(38-40) synthase TruA [Pseudomonadota bacterium]
MVPQHLSNDPLPRGARVALCVEYDGSPFSGWQRQPQHQAVQTVQGCVEAALTQVAAAQITLSCAGRTDTGVHATAQWVHFDTPVSRSLKAWLVGANAHLPKEIRIVRALGVPGDFHARHSAVMRQYDYLIHNSARASALLAERVLWHRRALNVAAMNEALKPLLGENDFSSFRAASCQSNSPMRFVATASVDSQGALLRVRLRANAYLHHMVRNIVGSLLEVGQGSQTRQWLGELLELRDRTRSGPTAPPHGLYLTQVEYPERFAIPLIGALPYFPPDRNNSGIEEEEDEEEKADEQK